MPKKKFKDTPEKQYKRFLETAKELEADESGKAFDLVVEKVITPIPVSRQSGVVEKAHQRPLGRSNGK